jgi:rubrerythrin
MKVWICEVCGYEHTGDKPPEACPLCGAPASKFTEKK